MFILSTGALAALALAAPAAAGASPTAVESPPPPALVQERLLGGLLGGILDPIVDPILEPVLGGEPATTPLPVDTDVVGGIVGSLLGTTPLDSTALTGVVTGLLGGGVPAEVPVVGDLVDDLLATSGGTLPVAGLVSSLLAQGVTAELVPTVLAQALGSSGATPDLITSLVEGAVGELLVTGLPTDPAALTAVLGALAGGAPATGSLLAPVAGILDTLAANPLVPAELRATLASLSAQIGAAGDGLLAGDLLGSLGGVLDSLGTATGGTSSPLSPVFAGLGRLLIGSGAPAAPPAAPPATTAPTFVFLPAPGGGTTAAPARIRLTRSMRATVRKVRVSKTRRTVKATLKCPSVAILGCAVTARIRYRGANTGKKKTVVMLPNTTRSVSLRVPAKRSRTMKRRGGRVYVRAQSYLGSFRPTASRSVSVKKSRSAKKRSAAR